jgi:hypothetical protein
MTKRYLITTAVNETRVHTGFWGALKTYAREQGAELLVVAAMYKNPTAKRGKAKRLAESVYAKQVVPYLTRDTIRLGRNLTLFADVPVQPTASSPTSGFEVLCAGTSAIIGHVKRAMTVVPTETRSPRVIWSTGACTLAKYSKSRAGARAKRHHALGAVVVECERGGDFYVRHVSGNHDGSFTDLDRVYTATGSRPAPSALSVVLGDVHVGHEDEAVLEASEALVDLLKPKHLVLHDVLDMSSRSHHRQGERDRYDGRFDTVEAEVKANAAMLTRFAHWDCGQVDVVRSNHDEHLTRWLQEFRPDQDIVNVPYWHRLKARVYDHREEHGSWPNEFEMEMRRLEVPYYVKFLSREDSLRVGNVEHSFHGDDGVNGSRGSILGYTKLGAKVTIGHSHTPGIRDGVFQTGVTGSRRMGYNRRPSTWLNAHVVLHADGKRQLVVIINGKFRGTPCQSARTRATTVTTIAKTTRRATPARRAA